MNSLNKIVLRNLKLNKKRTIGTIIGIVLSVALLCAVAGMFTTLQNTLVQSAISSTGYYHVTVKEVSEEKLATLKNNRDIKTIYPVTNLGSAILTTTGTTHQYGNVYSMEKTTFENLAFKLATGRFPKNSNEIIVSEYINMIGGPTYQIGDKITLNVGTLNFDEKTHTEEIINPLTKTYTIVGMMENTNNRFPFPSLITTKEKAPNISAYLALKNPKTYEKSISEIFGVNKLKEVDEQYYSLNTELVRWECFEFSDSTVTMLSAVITVVLLIIVLTSVFCIKNAFDISTTEKIKMYGMLSSIGATKKQIKHNVIREGLMLGLVGIPLGILLGIIAIAILVLLVNTILTNSGFFPTDFAGLSMKVPLLSILLSIALGFITIYLSAISSAKKASRVSPIEQLTNSSNIKIKTQKLKTPYYIKKIFKTGGVIAHKNLKRSKKKYRTTVISLVVSIFAFISMSSFITYTFSMLTTYYEQYDYNLLVRTEDQDTLQKIVNLPEVTEATTLYESKYAAEGYLKISDISKMTEFGHTLLKDEDCSYDKEKDQYLCKDAKTSNLKIVAVDTTSFKEYAKELKLEYQNIKNQGILVDEYQTYNADGVGVNKRIYNYKKNDTIQGIYNHQNLEIKVAKITSKRPNGLEQRYYRGGYLLVDYDQYQELGLIPNSIAIKTKDATSLDKSITEKFNVTTRNIDEDKKQESSVYVVVAIFLYGFIIVITLIGITNIFNTITSNMELRQKEFAMLKSIGMTKQEFNRMINLETLFYCTKSLVFGIILGLLGSFAIYKAFAKKIDFGFQFPYQAMLIAIVFVFCLVFIIMRYSINKINKQNTIETIRNENI